jgi:hypothetical protein
MQSDPSETGGLFVGRRPGTAPTHYTEQPQRAGGARQRIDRHMAEVLFGSMGVVSLLCWGPIPLASLWVGAQVDYLSGSVSLGILTAFVVLFVLLFGALRLLRAIDNMWILVRRAAGYDQRSGTLGKIFAVAAAVCGGAFMIWFVLIHGPGAEFSGNGGGL